MDTLAKGYYYGFWAVAMAGIGFLGWALFFCWGQDYAEFTTQLLSSVDKLDWRSYFEEAVMPEGRFQFMRWLLIGLMVCYISLLLWSYRRWGVAAQYLEKASLYFCASFVDTFKGLKSWQYRIFLFLAMLFLLRTIWHIEYYAIEYDEAWTYNHFSSKGVFVAIISPNNNHIFYTILSALADKVPLSTKWVIRLPALLAASLAFLLFFSFIRKTLAVNAALIALAYFAFSSGMNFFGVLGRGYGWQLVWGILQTAAVYKIMMGGQEKRWKFLYVLSFVLGVYSNPTYLYLGLGLGLLYFTQSLRQWADLRSFLLVQLLTGVILIILHLPLFLTNGFSILMDAASLGKEQVSYRVILYHLHRMVDWIFWGRGSLLFWGYLLLLGVLLSLRYMLFFRKEQKILFSIAYLRLLLPFVYTVIAAKETPYRIWGYLVIFLALILAIFVEYCREAQLGMLILFIIPISSASFYASETHYFLNWSAKLDKDAKKIAHLLLEHEALENCYSFARYDKPLLEFYFLDAKRNFRCWMPFEESKDYQAFDQQIYDAVLLDVEDYKPTEKDWKLIELNDYQLIYENERVKLYLSPKIK